MRLNPGLSLVRLAEDTVQVGSGSRSTQLSGCTPAVMAFLDRLAAGIPDDGEREAVRTCGLDPAEARELVSMLEGFLHRQSSPPGPGAGHAADVLAQDLAAALAVEPGPVDSAERAADLLDRRRRAGVQVLGLGRTGAAVARSLAAAGIGRLVLWDRAEVATADLGTGYLPGDLGRIRPVALARRIDDVGLDPVVLPLTTPLPPGPGADATVVVTRGAVDPESLALARAADHALLPVVVRDDDVLVGPWCAPAATGCPGCWDLAAAATDPLRPARTEALLAAGAGREDLTLALAAGALAARRVLQWVDTGAVDAGTVLHLQAGTGRVDTLHVPAHPGCACAPAG
ncbi:ThiF family adenylyltransferase [Citricoccus sp. SGAir0253]|uniref:ThiF family adenylyltransferase n=1 Tax=Citricoccus sp. SGAir0253 TaxID=2567881 RepID=UPI00143CDE5E|nr:ThiF family adenylyltransferase [Citricoccus sp. SGAir0253]